MMFSCVGVLCEASVCIDRFESVEESRELSNSGCTNGLGLVAQTTC